MDDVRHHGLMQSARDARLLRALGADRSTPIPRQALTDAIVRAGLRLDDPRLEASMARLAEVPAGALLSGEDLLDVIRPSGSLVERALCGDLVIPDFAAFQAEICAIYAAARANEAGVVADYIPQLARVSGHHFGVSLCTVDGQRASLGDARVGFSVQSCAKPINYCLALEQHGEDAVHQIVGREPSGRGFNELTLNKDHKPHNPMLNSGAIATCSLIRQGEPLADRFDHVMAEWARLAGRQRAGFSNAVYLSERQTADRNYALGYFMRENRVFSPTTDLVATLEFYFQCCSIESDCERMAVVAATLATGGICPITGERVLSPSTVRSCLSLMDSCGMYDFSGEFAFTIGLPAKSGVSGALMVVVPNVMGFCTWSPRLDALGNSVRGIDFCKRLVERYNFHNYDHLIGSIGHKKDPRRREEELRAGAVARLCWAASQGDLVGLEGLLARGVDPNLADYDGRTALHVAASDGQSAIVEALLAHGAFVNPRDRWGNTPLDDARRGASIVRTGEDAGTQAVVALLERAGGEGSDGAARPVLRSDRIGPDDATYAELLARSTATSAESAPRA